MKSSPSLYPKLPLMFGGTAIVILGIITLIIWQEIPGQFEFIIPGKRGSTSLGYIPSLPVFAAFLFAILGTLLWISIVLLTRLDVMVRTKKLLPLATYTIAAATIAVTITVSADGDVFRIIFAWVFALLFSLPVFASTSISLGEAPFTKKRSTEAAEQVTGSMETKP